MRVLITGGAGFTGSALALYFKNRYTESQIIAFDNLKRRGSELNLPKLRQSGIEFIHGDVRNEEDWNAFTGEFDLLIECSAEPSVQAGVATSPRYLLNTNLCATIHALEFSKNRVGFFCFLSTSRVYSMAPLREIPLLEKETRLDCGANHSIVGLTDNGISEQFPVHLPRSFYGTSKLASEYLIQEYADNSGLKAVINRCGVIAGPGQMGKVDQGVFTLWVARHFFGLPLNYIGYGGSGKQVRDLLHIDDVCALIEKQFKQGPVSPASVYNVGGGRKGSTSLLEFTRLCQAQTGRSVPINGVAETSSVDVPWILRAHWERDCTILS
ncbi:unnamed protein product [Sphagnum balticum]